MLISLGLRSDVFLAKDRGEEGFLSGISSGAATEAAARLASQP
jgi:hypothetical protein